MNGVLQLTVSCFERLERVFGRLSVIILHRSTSVSDLDLGSGVTETQAARKELTKGVVRSECLSMSKSKSVCVLLSH